MIHRLLKEEILDRARNRPVIFLTGPRQCGKTTLAQETFPHYKYVLLEREHIREQIAADVEGFLLDAMEKEQGLIIDEFQHIPSITSYLQGIVDASPRPGFFILTGSQNFLMMKQITQTLTGRAALIQMLPLSLSEAAPTDSIEEVMFRGLFPWPYEQKNNLSDIRKWAFEYVNTYLERDVRSLEQIKDLSKFQRFLELLATHVGCLLNTSALANQCNITVKQAEEWISVLETCYVIMLVEPYYENFNKTIVKSPKIYFVDTALICSLLRIEDPDTLKKSTFYGAIFENLIIMELRKANVNFGDYRTNIYFWRDTEDNEVDAILKYGLYLRGVEIKSKQEVKPSITQALTYWANNAKKHTPTHLYVIYGGEKNVTIGDTTWVSWRRCEAVNLRESNPRSVIEEK